MQLFRRLRAPTRQELWLALRLAAVVAVGGAGALLVTDRPGLQAEYFSLGAPWEGEPRHIGIAQPSLASRSDLGDVLMTEVLFSVRWSGWWSVSEAGTYRFSLDADDGAYLRLDGDLVADTAGLFGEPRPAGEAQLAAGYHEIEVGHFQRIGESFLALEWSRGEGEPPSSLESEALFAAAPVAPRAALRRALRSWSTPYRRLIGAALLLAAALMLPGLAGPVRRPAQRLASRLPNLASPGWRAGLLIALLVVAFFAALPFTGTVRGGDDTSYLRTAALGGERWYFGRYAHVYLLKLFIWLSGGDPLLATRVWWASVFAVTVAAMALAISSVGPGLQLRTLGVALFVLLAQTSLGMVGAPFADFTAMMFVTAAVAVYLHGRARARDHPPPRHEWHALALGALTVAAFRSKEVGAITLLLVLLLPFVGGRLQLRRFGRRMAYWAAGAAGVSLLLVALDAWLLGNPFFSFDGGRLATARRLNFPPIVEPRSATTGWLGVVWRPGDHPAAAALRNLWLAVPLAAAAASLRRRGLELRLLHLFPIAYLAGLVVLYIWMPHPFSSRMLIPILPVACLMAGLAAHYGGLDELEWKRLAEPRFLIPTTLAAAFLALVALPYRLGTVSAEQLVPVAAAARFGWEPNAFATVVWLPALGLGAIGCLALLLRHAQARVAALLLGYLAFFGLGFGYNQMKLARSQPAQRSDLLLYPWRTFRAELDAARPSTVALSDDLKYRFRMAGRTRSSVAQLALGRPDLRVAVTKEPPLEFDMAIASRAAWARWRRRAPELAEGAQLGPHGLLVLLRPREAMSQPAADPEGPAD